MMLSATSARDAVRGASPAGCPTCEGREVDSAAGEGNGAARSAAACALPLPQRPRLWLRRSRAVSVLQLHEGVVVGRKTCVKALLRAAEGTVPAYDVGVALGERLQLEWKWACRCAEACGT